jgi:hypothetical protein
MSLKIFEHVRDSLDCHTTPNHFLHNMASEAFGVIMRGCILRLAILRLIRLLVLSTGGYTIIAAAQRSFHHFPLAAKKSTSPDTAIPVDVTWAWV